jgi:hypothetical protein
VLLKQQEHYALVDVLDHSTIVIKLKTLSLNVLLKQLDNYALVDVLDLI